MNYINYNTVSVYINDEFEGYTDSLATLNKVLGDGDTIEIKMNHTDKLGVTIEYRITKKGYVYVSPEEWFPGLFA